MKTQQTTIATRLTLAFTLLAVWVAPCRAQTFPQQGPVMPTLSDLLNKQRIYSQYHSTFGYGSIWYGGYPGLYQAPVVSQFGLPVRPIQNPVPFQSMPGDTPFLNPLNQFQNNNAPIRDRRLRRELDRGPINPFNGQPLNE